MINLADGYEDLVARARPVLKAAADAHLAIATCRDACDHAFCVVEDELGFAHLPGAVRLEGTPPLLAGLHRIAELAPAVEAFGSEYGPIARKLREHPDLVDAMWCVVVDSRGGRLMQMTDHPPGTMVRKEGSA